MIKDSKNNRSLFVKRGRTLSLVATLAALAVLSAIVVFDVIDDALALTSQKGDRVSVTVDSASELPEAMQKLGLVRHGWLFGIYVDLKGGELKRNTATVSADMDYRALWAAFNEDEPIRTVRLSFSPRMSVEQMVEIFVENGIGSREGFVRAINEYPFEYDFLDDIPQNRDRSYRLEGYLYPDTYDFYTGRSESYYIDRMLSRFEEVTEDVSALCEREGMTLDEALTVASLIECSSGFPSAYDRLSSVIRNRLDKGMPLEIPASSVYGITSMGGLHTGVASDELVETDSPYNLYKNKGLPPGPLCSPTREAILCAILPEKGQYLYFITQKSGKVFFAVTSEEHAENVALQRREEY